MTIENTIDKPKPATQSDVFYLQSKPNNIAAVRHKPLVDREI